MTDLIKRLRFELSEGYTICGEAADEIEHLVLDLHTERAAVAALREELANARAVDVHSCHDGCTRAGCVAAGLRAEVAAIEEQAVKNADEVLALREQVTGMLEELALAETVRAAQVAGLTQGMDALREERDALRDWVRDTGLQMDICTRNILGKVCEYCQCKHRKATP